MSRLFTRFFGQFFNSHIHEPLSQQMNQIIGRVVATVSISGIIGHCVYAFATAENKIIKVANKYQFDRNGFTEFMIIDDNGKHYNVNNSVWYQKWDSIEDWHKLETNKEIVIKYYGWRIPLFGLFPNIIMCKQDKVLDSITSAEYRVIEYNYNKNKNKHIPLLTNNKEKLNLSQEEKDEIQLKLNPYYHFVKHIKPF